MKEIQADIITIGDEILYGQTIDTNSAFMATLLQEVGIKIRQITSISDKRDAILEALETAEKASRLVLITGGLGPTRDDITKHTLCEYFDDHLEMNETAWQHVQEFYKSRDREISEVNRQQAFLPTKSTCLPNTIGTASGMWLEQNNTIFISMPGVPREMKKLMTDEVMPKLKEHLSLPNIDHLFVNTVGVPESTLAEKISDWEDQLPAEIKLAYLPSLGSVKLRLTLWNGDKSILEQEVEKLKKRIEPYIFSYGKTSLPEAIAQLLQESNLTIATAESCTGGGVAKALTSVPGSSAYFIGGTVSYANEAKTNVLHVDENVLKEKGAVSEEVAIQMALGAQKQFATDIAVSTTGVAGPDGGTEEKPVGTVWIAIAYKGDVTAKKLTIGNLGRTQNIELTIITVLNLIRKTLNQN